MAQNSDTVTLRPAFASIDDFCVISGMRRRAVYDALGLGHLKAIKRGSRTLIDVDAGLAWMRTLPPAKIRAPKRSQPADAA